MNRVLILGINGFIGTHFAEYVASNHLYKRYEFIGIDKNIDQKSTDGIFQYRQLDLLSPDSMNKLLQEVRPDYLMNFAGIFGSTKYENLIEINVGITRSIFEGIHANTLSIKNMLLIGSAAEYGNVTALPVRETTGLNPINDYGLSKVFQYYTAKYFNYIYTIPYSLARIFNVFGKGLSADLSIGFFLKQIESAQDGDSIIAGNIDTKRDFLDISTVAAHLWKILLSGKPNEVYNVCSGHSVTIRSILEKMINESGKTLSISIDQSRIKKFDIMDMYGDNSKLLSIS